jgi:uncharacterized protein YdeI (BOF family)
MKSTSLFLVCVFCAGLVSAHEVSGESPDVSRINAGAPASPEGAIRISDVKRGQNVILHGTVDRIRDEDEFMLKDDTGRIKFYLGKLGRMPVKVGDVVTVHGKADDDVLPGLRPEIYASRLLLADGTSIDVEHWD